MDWGQKKTALVSDCFTSTLQHLTKLVNEIIHKIISNTMNNDRNNNNPRPVFEVSSSDNNGGSGSSNLDSDERNSSNSSGSASGSAGEEDRASNEDSEGGSSSVVSDAEEDDDDKEEESSQRKRQREASARPKPPPVAAAAAPSGKAKSSNNDNTTERESAAARKTGKKYVQKNSLNEQELLQQRDEIRARIKNKETNQLTEEEIAEDRRATNRLSAFQSRKRRKMIIEDLQKTVADLTRHGDAQKDEIESLRSELNEAENENRSLRQELEMRKQLAGSGSQNTNLLPRSSVLQGSSMPRRDIAFHPPPIQSNSAILERSYQFPTPAPSAGLPNSDLGNSNTLLSAAAMLLGSAPSSDGGNAHRREETLDLLQEFLDIQRQISNVQQEQRGQRQEQSHQAAAPSWSQPSTQDPRPAPAWSQVGQSAPFASQEQVVRGQEFNTFAPQQGVVQQQDRFGTQAVPSHFASPPVYQDFAQQQQIPHQASHALPPSSVYSSTANSAPNGAATNATDSQLLSQLCLLLQGNKNNS